MVDKPPALDSNTRDRFGFLPYNRPIEFHGGTLLPLPTFAEAAEWVATYKHKDGFLYPPVVTTQRGSRLPDRAFSTWRCWPEHCRRLFTNSLYMDSRSPSYEWEWEKFAIN
jgi:hypothetical protein